MKWLQILFFYQEQSNSQQMSGFKMAAIVRQYD